MTTTTKRPPVRAPKKPPARRTTASAETSRTPAPASAKSTTTRATTTAKTTTAKTAATKTAAKTAAVKTGAARGTSRRAAAPPRAPFVLLIVGLLGGALVSLLLLNTVLAKDAFTLTRLQQSNKLLDQQRQALEEDIARGDSPAQLSKKAEALDLRRPEEPAFFYSDSGRASGGRIRPVPHEAVASAGAAGVIGVPGTVVPGDGVPPAATGQGTR